MCEGLFASGQNAETFLMPALIPVAEDLFCSRTSSDPASELETQREVMLTMLIKLLPYSQVQYHTSLFLQICFTGKYLTQKAIHQLSDQENKKCGP